MASTKENVEPNESQTRGPAWSCVVSAPWDRRRLAGIVTRVVPSRRAPCVAGVDRATEVLRDAAKVEVDGATDA